MLVAAEEKQGLAFCKVVVGGVFTASGSVLSGLQDGVLSDTWGSVTRDCLQIKAKISQIRLKRQ